MIVEPYIYCVFKLCNARKLYSSDIYLLPTIAFRPFEKTIMNIKRYERGSWKVTFQICIMFLLWEFSVSLTRKNYRDL